MPYRTLDTERIEWRDPTFFEEERMVRQALPKIHVLASDLWVLSQRFQQAATYDCFDDHLDAWTSWICVYAFFGLVEAKRTDVRWAYRNSLRHLMN